MMAQQDDTAVTQHIKNIRAKLRTAGVAAGTCTENNMGSGATNGCKRNLTPLRNVLVRYLVVCGGGSLVILLVWWGLFMSLIHNGFFAASRYRGAGVQRARDYAATATVETFDPNAIDPLCRYAILQVGTAHVLQTNMTAIQLKKARSILRAAGSGWMGDHTQYVVDMADGARCILQYDYSRSRGGPAGAAGSPTDLADHVYSAADFAGGDMAGAVPTAR